MNLYGRRSLSESEGASAKTLGGFLERSREFETALVNCFPNSAPMLVYAERKCGLALASVLLSLEHASVLRSAFASVAPNSAAALLRLQFETLVRAAWLLHTAAPEQVDRLDITLDQDAESLAERLPKLHEMLAAIGRHAPRGLSWPLAEFNTYHRRALNSFVHGGIHALSRRQSGFPVELAIQLIKVSNALQHLAYRLLAELGGGGQMDIVTNLHREFKDCLPPFKDGENQAGT